MEACMMKPGVKTKPKSIKRNEPEQPPPAVPLRPTDAELSHTQYRLNKLTATNNEELNSPTRCSQRRPSAQTKDAETKDTEIAKETEQPEAAAVGIFWRSQKERMPTLTVKESLQSEASASNGSLSENNSTKEKRSVFRSIFKKSPKLSEGPRLEEGAETLHGRPSASTDSLSESKGKGGLFSGLFRKTLKTPGEGNLSANKDVSGSSDSPSEAASTKEKGLFREASGARTESPGIEAQKELLTSNDDLSDNNITEEKDFWGKMFEKPHKPAESAAAEMESEGNTEDQFSASWENLSDSTVTKEKTGGLAGLFKRSPKPSPRSIATQDPLSSHLSDSWDSLTDAGKEDVLAKSQLSTSNDNFLVASSTPKEKKVGFSGITGMFRQTEEQQEGEDMEAPEGGGLRCKTTIKKKRQVVSFRVKKTLPKIPEIGLASQSSDKMPVTEQTFEMQEMNQAQVSTFVVQPVEMAAYPTEENPAEIEPEEAELMEWWNTVKGWTEWNEASDFQEEDEEMAMEQAADRVYMAARLFVRLFNQHGGSLQHRILELLAMADAADEFHKKTVSAAVGGGVASVAGSITTITGLILAPFTFGTSVIVTAVGIGVATAGSITSATANITDTVHSNMDCKKVEKMIQGYQEEIKDIRECLEFVQEGIDTLQEWDFEKYAQSAAKKALNHNIKHVMKEGGRAGKTLMINTEKLISTVQVLSAAGGVAKAARAISVTTGVISALFLALDVFFLARNSHELRKGAKTQFASKIREVCKDLQNGLLELNKVKTQLQKTMDGIEVEEFEEVEEVEVEAEDDLASDPKKLAELEQELDLLEEKVDKKVEDVQKKVKEMEENSKIKKEKKDEKEKKKDKEKKEDNNIKNKVEEKSKSKLEKIPDEEKKEKNEASDKTSKEEVLKEQLQKESKQDKDTKNQITSGNDKHESMGGKIKDDIGTNKTTEKETHKTGKEQEKVKSTSEGNKSERVKIERESERRRSSRDDGEMKPPEKTPVNEKAGERSKRRHSSRSEQGGERGGKHLTGETGEGWQSCHKDGQSTRSWEEERGVKDWRAEMTKGREEKREGQETERRKESHQDDEISSTNRRESERESGSSRDDSKRSHPRTGHEEQGERRDEKNTSLVVSTRRQFERAGGEGEEDKAKRRQDGGNERSNTERRGSEKDVEHEHSHRGHRARSNDFLRDRLNI
ncbi:uncharacterized protein apold1a isoform X2 [Archocentrus centrarchus]|uniref:uncharacterized protein apold1a isoform X2 n=1 Tax=Archocentrus centrarchus TaxID=63155 RepID=UPI0011EA513D|nr:uncharacterized protein LOC115796389 isoform X2 [Archocentrus centrarchus]XP_030608649.1 uncharacterized protein LOC115796389 isoform X2 [Archocentrus centrarchus]